MMSKHPLHITWLVPDDRGGGLISMAEACCRQAALVGHEATLLLALTPEASPSDFAGVRIESLHSPAPYVDVPDRLIAWLKRDPPDVLLLNGCGQADFALPNIPSETRVIYVVHDTADLYFIAALRNEEFIDAVVAVSETVANRFRHRLKDPGKLHVVLNGTVFPIALEHVLASQRADDLLYLGGDNPTKGSHDVLALWSILQALGYLGNLHWFGTIEEDFRKRVSALPGSERIIIYGRQPRAVLFQAAAKAKVLLMLSRVEPFGMVTIEAMGMGCLPVAWDIVTGTKEIVAKQEGIFAPLGDYDALAQGVLRGLEMHRSHFSESTVRVRREFSEEALWRRYAAAFESDASVPPGPSAAGRCAPPSVPSPVAIVSIAAERS